MQDGKHIQGIRIRIDSKTLQQHCQLRAATYTERTGVAFENAKQLRKLLGSQTPDKSSKGYSGGGADASQEALDKARNFDRIASRFTALAKYMIMDVVYELSDHEADSLELTTQFRKRIDWD